MRMKCVRSLRSILSSREELQDFRQSVLSQTKASLVTAGIVTIVHLTLQLVSDSWGHSSINLAYILLVIYLNYSLSNAFYYNQKRSRRYHFADLPYDCPGLLPWLWMPGVFPWFLVSYLRLERDRRRRFEYDYTVESEFYAAVEETYKEPIQERFPDEVQDFLNEFCLEQRTKYLAKQHQKWQSRIDSGKRTIQKAEQRYAVATTEEERQRAEEMKQDAETEIGRVQRLFENDEDKIDEEFRLEVKQILEKLVEMPEVTQVKLRHDKDNKVTALVISLRLQTKAGWPDYDLGDYKMTILAQGEVSLEMERSSMLANGRVLFPSIAIDIWRSNVPQYVEMGNIVWAVQCCTEVIEETLLETIKPEPISEIFLAIPKRPDSF